MGAPPTSLSSSHCLMHMHIPLLCELTRSPEGSVETLLDVCGHSVGLHGDRADGGV